MTKELEKMKRKTIPTATGNRKKRNGLFSRVWNAIFRLHGDDFEKRLEYISKEEAVVLARINRRSRSWRRTTRHLILFSVIFEVIVVSYAVMTARSKDINWKMRAFRILPMFLLPAISTAAYSTFISFARMCDRRDQRILERLRAKRQAKIDELKEKTNYYITQQLIQKYDPDPAAKAAAATVLASKLGADSGLKVHVGDESMHSGSTGESKDHELVESKGLLSRKQVISSSSSPGTTTPMNSNQQFVGSGSIDRPQISMHNQLVTHEGGWMARIVALLVGEDPRQSYALICFNCHMHNGLAQKADFPYITYYCRHCHALNKPIQLDERISGFSSQNMGCPKADEVAENASASTGDSIVTNNSPVNASLEMEEVSKKAGLEESWLKGISFFVNWTVGLGCLTLYPFVVSTRRAALRFLSLGWFCNIYRTEICSFGPSF